MRYLARKSGFDVQRRWFSSGPTCLPEPEVEAVLKGGPCDSQLLGFVRRFEHGLIRHRPGVNRCCLLAQMIRAWPNATFAIATASYAEGRRIRKGLYEFGVRTTLVTTKHCPDRPGWVVIGTFAAMAHNSVEANKRHVFICANAAHALGEQAQRCLLMVDAGFRLFGLLSEDRRVSPAERDLLVTTFGLHGIAVPARGTTVIIWASSGPGLPPVPPGWRMAPAGEPANMIVVDMDDRGEPTLAQWTRRRKKAYRYEEWFPPGADPHVERIKRFLATRPGGRRP